MHCNSLLESMPRESSEIGSGADPPTPRRRRGGWESESLRVFNTRQKSGKWGPESRGIGPICASMWRIETGSRSPGDSYLGIGRCRRLWLHEQQAQPTIVGGHKWCGQALIIVEVEAGPARFRQLQESAIGLPPVSTAQAACRAPASEAVTAVTSYSSSTPLFFGRDRKSTRLNSSHLGISYAVF